RSPLVFGCGNLHIENFGAYLSDNRLAYFDQSEFDEARLLPATAEMVRLLASIMVALHLHEPDDLDPKRSAKGALEAYAQALAEGKPQWIERDLARGPIADVLSSLSRRLRREELDLFSRGARRGRRKLLRDGRRSAALPKEKRALENEVKSLFGAIGKERDERGFWKLRDLAQCVTTRGSLGRPRYIALIKGQGDPDGNVLVDLKAAWPSALAVPAETRRLQSGDAAEHVVFVQRLMQARTPAFLQPVSIGDKAFVLSEFQPLEDRLDIDALLSRPRRFAYAIETLARITAWNQLRAAGRRGASDVESLIEFASSEEWQRELLEAADECAAKIERDYASFETAWRKHDTCLTSLADG
ncbi:MAG: DUF2252 family protein, partial [Hyphomicrobiales bacterium]|nr:DUF2252 family protein [Hyphomicrobiales bacterium]